MFLKILLNWPASFFTWDILFLIPVPWVGPVLAPCITSVTMILLALTIIHYQQKNKPPSITFFEWILFVFGSIASVVSFMWDYFNYLSLERNANPVWTLAGNTNMFTEIRNYIPQHFNWFLFGIGEGLILFAIMHIVKRLK